MIQAHFKEWLLSSGNMRQVYDLARCLLPSWPLAVPAVPRMPRCCSARVKDALPRATC